MSKSVYNNDDRGHGPLFVLREHRHPVMCGSFYPNVETNSTASRSETTAELLPLTSESIAKAKISNNRTLQNSNLFISGDAGGIVNVWDLNLRRVIYTFNPVESAQRQMSQSKSSKLMPTCSNKSSIGVVSVGFLEWDKYKEYKETICSELVSEKASNEELHEEQSNYEQVTTEEMAEQALRKKNKALTYLPCSAYRKFFSIRNLNERLKMNVKIERNAESNELDKKNLTSRQMASQNKNLNDANAIIYLYTQCRTHELHIWKLNLRYECEKLRSNIINASINTNNDATTEHSSGCSHTLLHSIPVPQYGFCQVACEYDKETNGYLFAIPHDRQSTFSIWLLTPHPEKQNKENELLHCEQRQELCEQQLSKQESIEINAEYNNTFHHSCTSELHACHNNRSEHHYFCLESSPFQLRCLCTTSATSSSPNINGGVIMSFSLNNVNDTLCNRENDQLFYNTNCNNNNNSINKHNALSESSAKCQLYETNTCSSLRNKKVIKHIAIALESGHISLCKLEIEMCLIDTESDRLTSRYNTCAANKDRNGYGCAIERQKMEDDQGEEDVVDNANHDCFHAGKTEHCQENVFQADVKHSSRNNNDVLMNYSDKRKERVKCKCTIIRIFRLFSEPAMSCVWCTTNNYLLATSANGDVHCYEIKWIAEQPDSNDESKEQCYENGDNSSYFGNNIATTKSQDEDFVITLLWQKLLRKGVGSATVQRQLMLLGSWDNSVRLFDVCTGRVISILVFHLATINALTIMCRRTAGLAQFAFDVREPHTYTTRLQMTDLRKLTSKEHADMITTGNFMTLQHETCESNTKCKWPESETHSFVSNNEDNEAAPEHHGKMLENEKIDVVKTLANTTVPRVDHYVTSKRSCRASNVYVFATMSSDCTVAIWRIDFNVVAKQLIDKYNR